MKNIINWLKESNRGKHLLGGMAIGVLANDWYCALLAGTTAAFCLELKDKLWGGQWNWIDFGLTVAGTAAGFAARVLLLGCLI